MSKNIYLDIGNSYAKWKFQENYFKVPIDQFELDKLPRTSKIWLSNVSNIIDFSKTINLSLVKSHATYKSLKNSYNPPHLLGSDRWLAMIATYEICQNSFVLIDIGSAVTIDVVDSSGNHQGGLIFPGLHKIRQTFKFPLKDIENIQVLGNSTEKGWSIGTLILLVNLINFKVNKLKTEFPDACIFITGGGFEDVKKYLNFSYEYHKNLVLDGLEFFADNMG